jgi:hypothetical protein
MAGYTLRAGGGAVMDDEEYALLCEDLRDVLKEFSEMIQDIRLNWREVTHRDCPFTHHDIVVDIFNVSEELARESQVIRRYLEAVERSKSVEIH